MGDITMNDAAMAGGSADGDSRVLGMVRKFRAAGMEQPVAEAVAEELAHLPTRAEMREDIQRAVDGLELKMRAMIAEQFQKMVILMLAMHGLTIALLSFVIVFLK